MNKRKEEHSSNSVADEVEKSLREKTVKAENFVKKALDNFELLFYHLLEIKPK